MEGMKASRNIKTLFLLLLLQSGNLWSKSDTYRTPPSPSEIMVEAARSQVGKTLSYDPSYVSLAYPNGDVPIDKGVCTDVIIRALRNLGADLQQLIHEDMKENFRKYPRLWGDRYPDKNIDHRRVPNIARYLERKQLQVPLPTSYKSFHAGDILVCRVFGNLPHILIISDKKTLLGRKPYVIHNVGNGVQEEDFLDDCKHEALFRWKK